MHLAFVTQKYPPSPLSGSIGTVFQQLAQGLSAAGHAVHVITRADAGEPASSTQEGAVRIHRIAMPKATGLVWRLEQRLPVLFRLRYSRAVSRCLKTLLRNEGLDCAISPEYAAETWWYAAFAKRAPLLVSLHGPSFAANALNHRRGVSAALEEWFERSLVRRARTLHAVSQHLADKVAARMRVARDRITVIRNPIDGAIFQRQAPTFRKAEPPQVLYVGRLERLKGVEVLAQAMPLVHQHRPEVRAVLIGRDDGATDGEGSMKQHLLELLGASADRVTFLDPIPREALAPYYQASTCCAFPSFAEGFPTVTLEAMACGTPVIGTWGTGHAEIIAHRQNGLLIEPGSPQKLAAAILELLGDETVQAAYSAAAHQSVTEAFTLARVLPQWETLLWSVTHR